MTKSALRSLVVAGLVGAFAGQAHAAAFTITIKNTSTYNWSAGVISFSPLLPLGATPTSGNGYTVYGYTTSGCNVYANDDGDATDLVGRIGLTSGTNAFVVPAINAGATGTVAINVPAGNTISYIADIYGSGTEAEDDVVMMHAVGNTSNLSVPVFDANGYALTNVAFELSGYDTNSTSSTSGTATSCTPKCPTPKTGCYVALGNGTTGGTLTAQPTPANFSHVWTYPAGAGYTPDGLALGHLTSTTDNQLVAVMESGQYTGAFDSLGQGRVQVLNRAGTLSSTFDASLTGHDLMGLPLVETLDQGSTYDFLAGEFLAATPAPGASVYARTSTAAAAWTSQGYGYPGFWNMGPMSGDVRSDVTGNEIIVATWTGDIAVLNAATAATLNTYSSFTQLNEQLYGHVAVGNVVGATTGTVTNEIVGFGSTTGTVFAIDTTSAGATLAWKSTPPSGLYAFGSGPAIGDIDNDGNPEIVVAGAGTGVVYAYDPRAATGSGCKYKWSTPGGFDYSWSSPVIGQVDTDANKEVVVYSSDSVLSVLGISARNTGTTCVEGVVEWKYNAGTGGPSWFTPALANMTGTTSLDVLLATYNTVEVVDIAAKQLAYRYVDSTAEFYPSAVIDAGSGTPGQIYISGWANHNIYRLDLPTTAPTPVAWTGFMGNNQRTGAR